jgi:hypothetical protein
MEKIKVCHGATVKKVFSPMHKAELEGLDDDAKNEVFTRIWTEYEAVLKQRGIGFGEGWEKEPIENCIIHTVRFHDFFLTCATEQEAAIVIEKI